VKILANYLFDRLRIESVVGFFYSFLYRYLFRSIGKRSFVSPFIYPLGLDCVTLGSNSSINRHTRLLALKRYRSQIFRPAIYIGNNVSIGFGCTLSCINRIHVCDDVTIGDKVYIADSHHEFIDITVGIREQHLRPGDIFIGQGAWLGYGAFLAGNIVIGEHAVVGANSVVTRSVEPYTVVAGSPAKPIRRYNSETNQWEKIGSHE
jgi:acetyltransferase-like isoleucine patch superfamily enzyme